MKTYKVKKGDSSKNLVFSVENYPNLDNNWACKTEILTSISGNVVPILSRLNPKRGDNSAWDVNITPTETSFDAFEEGVTYFWQITTSNPTLVPAYQKTLVFKLEIEYKG